jgi:hypothetical protein
MLLGQKDISTIALKYAIMFHIFICFLTDLCTEVSALKKTILTALFMQFAIILSVLHAV